MFQITIIVFREILEIALILSVLYASTVGVKNRSSWILGGLGAGILGSIIVAFFTDAISNSFDGMGQEVFSAAILFIAAMMIGYTVIWMKQHAKNLNKEIKDLSKAVIDGEKSLYTLFVIVSVSVLREGSEIVLFSYSYFLAGTSILELSLGGILGLILGLIAGFAFYFGLIKTLGKYFFSTTTTILIFLSAGLVASSLGYLTDADLIPTIIDQLWDSSALISDSGIMGNILHILTGYTSKPSGVQLIGYLLSLSILFYLTRPKKLP
jgi:high-affinity iron transporter